MFIDPTGTWPQWLSDIGSALKKGIDFIAEFINRIAETAVAFISCLEFEAGLGIGLDVGFSFPEVEANAGFKMDLFNLEVNEGGVFLNQKMEAGAQAQLGPIEIGPYYSWKHPWTCDCEARGVEDCPYMIESTEWVSDNYISVGFNLYFIYGAKLEMRFNHIAFSEKFGSIWTR